MCGRKIKKDDPKVVFFLCFYLSPCNDFQSVAILCPNLIHYHVAERTGFEPVEPVAQLGSLANYWFQPLTHLSGLRLSSERTERKSRSKFVNDQISGLKINENNALEQLSQLPRKRFAPENIIKERLLPDIPYANSPVNRSKNTPSTNTETVAAPPPGNIGGIARGAAQPDHTPGQGKRTKFHPKSNTAAHANGKRVEMKSGQQPHPPRRAHPTKAIIRAKRIPDAL